MWTLSTVWTYSAPNMLSATLETIFPNNRLFMYANQWFFITIYEAVHLDIDWKFTLMEKALMSEASNEKKKDNFMERIMKSRSSWKIDFEMLLAVIGQTRLLNSLKWVKSGKIIQNRPRTCKFPSTEFLLKIPGKCYLLNEVFNKFPFIRISWQLNEFYVKIYQNH